MRVELLESLLQDEIAERGEAEHPGDSCKGSQDTSVELSGYKGWLALHGFVVPQLREIWEFFMNQLKEGLAIVGKDAEELVESLQAGVRLTIRPAHQSKRTNAQLTRDA